MDNNKSIRQARYELFERESNFEMCGEAENGKEAIAKVQEFDLIVLDPLMPVVNGFHAARVLTRLMPTVSLIMYTAFGDKVAESQALLIGISDVV